jgi:F0F1-type ATP synthase gamma subunit
MNNIKTLKQKIHLLEYIEKTLKSVESINLNKRAVLKKQHHIWEQVTGKITQLNRILHPTIIKDQKILMVIGSDNSLCGSYNSSLIKYFKHTTGDWDQYNQIYIIGKKINKISLAGAIYWDYKNFMNHLNEEFSWNTCDVDVIGYHTKEIGLINLGHWLEQQNILNEDETGDHDIIIEGPVDTNYNEILIKWALMNLLTTIEKQENIQRLIFLKSAIDNCNNEINNTVKEYRNLRQENITREINELIGANL